MYEKFYGMVHTPFARNVPPERLYESRQMKEVLGRLTFAADNHLFAVVTSEPGCGKSTLLRKFAANLEKDAFILVYLSSNKLSPKWMYNGIAKQLGLEAKFRVGDAKEILQKEVEIIQAVRHQTVVCVLDEAHLLDKETIEEFRFFLNYDFDSRSPVALILAGQNELWDDKLRLKRYTGIRDRVDVQCILNPLDRAETERYIKSHLDYARYNGGELFSQRAIEEIYKNSGGVPRRINRICEKALMYGYQQQRKIIDDHDITFVVDHEMLGGNAS